MAAKFFARYLGAQVFMDYVMRGSSFDVCVEHGAVANGQSRAQLVIVGEVAEESALDAKATIDAIISKHGGHLKVQQALQAMLRDTAQAWPDLNGYSELQNDGSQRCVRLHCVARTNVLTDSVHIMIVPLILMFRLFLPALPL